MSPRPCPVCGAGLERRAQGLRGEASVVCSLVAACPACGWVEEVCAPGYLPPPWRDRALESERTGLLVGRVEGSALTVALRRALGWSAATAAARAASAPGFVLSGLAVEVERLRDLLAARGLPSRALPAAAGPPDLALGRSAAGQQLALVSPGSLRAKAVLRAFLNVGGSEAPAGAPGALAFGGATALGVAAPRGRAGRGPRALIDAEGALVEVAGLGPPEGEAEAALFDALLEGLPALGWPAVIGLGGPDRGPWPLSLEACAGMAPARVVEALLSGNEEPR